MSKPGMNELRALAECHGLQPSYVDIHGQHREATAERLVQVLRALDVDLPDPSRPQEALALSRRQAWSELLDEVVVAWDGLGEALIRVPESLLESTYDLRVTTDAGEQRVRRGSIADLPIRDRAEVDGVVLVARTLPLPGNLPIGYHEIELHVAGRGAATALVLSAPRRVFAPADGNRRTWGVFMPLYARAEAVTSATCRP
jgi:4-alpha-glucanotransferase